MKPDRFTSYRDTDYMYSSALCRAKENKIMGSERLRQLIDSDSPREMLAECGYISKAKENGENINDALDLFLADSFDEIEEALPHCDGETLSAVTVLRYPYDCNNIKAAIKCGIIGISPESMLFSMGTLSADDAVAAANGEISPNDVKPNRKSRARGIPENMAKAIGEAREEFAATRNPRCIDLILDRACYADMLQAAEILGIPFISEYLRLKIDAVNILSALRVMEMYGENTPLSSDMLERVLLFGGSLQIKECTKDGLYESVKSDLRFDTFTAAAKDGISLSDAERILDNTVGTFIMSTRGVAFGAAVPFCYLLGLETSVKNARIVLAGRDAGQDRQVITEKLRLGYN